MEWVFRSGKTSISFGLLWDCLQWKQPTCDDSLTGVKNSPKLSPGVDSRKKSSFPIHRTTSGSSYSYSWPSAFILAGFSGPSTNICSTSACSLGCFSLSQYIKTHAHFKHTHRAAELEEVQCVCVSPDPLGAYIKYQLASWILGAQVSCLLYINLQP